MPLEICRLCLNNKNATFNIFEYNIANLSKTILECTSVEVKILDNDGLPVGCCLPCIQQVSAFKSFKEMCVNADSIVRREYVKISKCNLELDEQIEIVLKPSIDQSVFEHAEENNCNINGVRIYEVDNSIREIIGNNRYTCEICSSMFTSFFDYFDHQNTHNGAPVFLCSKCEKVFNNRQDLVHHDLDHKISCYICKLEILPKSMTAHLLIHTDTYRCSKCGLRHSSNSALEKHIQARHTDIRSFICHICGNQYSCQSSMKRHIAYHSNERPYKCNHCKFSAKAMNIVQTHTARIHFAEKRVCEICAKLFKSQHSLLQHKKRIHSTRKYICNICSKSFIESYNLKLHQKRHLEQRLYECKVCRKEFFTVRELKEHMHSHRQGCVTCPKCKKQFFYKKYYIKHISKCGNIENLFISDKSNAEHG